MSDDLNYPRMFNDFKCLLCNKRFKMRTGHPIFAGGNDEQYCENCLKLYRNPDGSMPLSIKGEREK